MKTAPPDLDNFCHRHTVDTFRAEDPRSKIKKSTLPARIRGGPWRTMVAGRIAYQKNGTPDSQQLNTD